MTLLDSPFPFVRDGLHQSSPSERDVTFLNIRENMNEGKTTTWFKYTSSSQYIPDELNIDLIAKVDTDTVIKPVSLLNEAEGQLNDAQNNLHPFPKLVYGGHRISTTRHYYIQGGFYFLSKNLAQYLTSDSCPRDEIIQAHLVEKHDVERAEDREIGAFVKRRERGDKVQKAQRLYLPDKVGIEHCKRFKEEQGFLEKWEGVLAKETARLHFERLLTEAKIGNDKKPYQDVGTSSPSWCPSEEAIQTASSQYDGADNLVFSSDDITVVLNLARVKDELMDLLSACSTTPPTALESS